MEHPTLSTLFKVFDISLELTAEESERVLNEVCGDDRYISAVAPIPGALRVVTRRYLKQPTPSKVGSSRKGFKAKDDNEAAQTFVSAHKDLSVRAIQAAMKDAGIARSTGWIGAQLKAIADERQYRGRSKSRPCKPQKSPQSPNLHKRP